MGLESLLGQPTARGTLEAALAADKVHHAYRFEGPEGVGKETAAFLLAQALVCPERPRAGCGTCSACVRAVTFATEAPHTPQHPDVLVIGRGLYPPALIGGKTEATGISVEQIRRIVMARVGYPPHESSALVIIIRAAEELTVSAANALLKTLEEPGRGVHFILLTSRPRSLLDTVLSRSLAVRFGPLPEEVLGALLEREGLPREVTPFAQGSMARARALAEPSEREAREQFVKALDDALEAGHAAAALSFAETRPDGRGEVLSLLAHVATTFAKRAREGEHLEIWAERHRIVSQTIRKIEANGSPALVLESMVGQLGRV